MIAPNTIMSSCCLETATCGRIIVDDNGIRDNQMKNGKMFQERAVGEVRRRGLGAFFREEHVLHEKIREARFGSEFHMRGARSQGLGAGEL